LFVDNLKVINEDCNLNFSKIICCQQAEIKKLREKLKTLKLKRKKHIIKLSERIKFKNNYQEKVNKQRIHLENLKKVKAKIKHLCKRKQTQIRRPRKQIRGKVQDFESEEYL